MTRFRELYTGNGESGEDGYVTKTTGGDRMVVLCDMIPSVVFNSSFTFSGIAPVSHMEVVSGLHWSHEEDDFWHSRRSCALAAFRTKHLLYPLAVLIHCHPQRIVVLAT